MLFDTKKEKYTFPGFLQQTQVTCLQCNTFSMIGNDSNCLPVISAHALGEKASHLISPIASHAQGMPLKKRLCTCIVGPCSNCNRHHITGALEYKLSLDITKCCIPGIVMPMSRVQCFLVCKLTCLCRLSSWVILSLCDCQDYGWINRQIINITFTQPRWPKTQQGEVGR